MSASNSPVRPTLQTVASRSLQSNNNYQWSASPISPAGSSIMELKYISGSTTPVLIPRTTKDDVNSDEVPTTGDASLTVTDNRTGQKIRIPIMNNTVSALSFRVLQGPNETEGLRIYDPAYQNTAATKSAICFIDGDVGILRYRGYPIEQLAEHSSYLEVSYLLLYGELPTKNQLDDWITQVMRHTFVHVRVTNLMQTFNYDAHPMGMFIASMAAMSAFHPEANPALQGANIFLNSERLRNKQFKRILGKVTTVAANAYRHRIGRPYNDPQGQLSYTENFLYMLDCLSEKDYKPNPVLAKALDVLFILHAEHELNCSTAAMRHISSSLVDPYSAIAGAASALYGPLHGGANEAVLHMLQEIGSVDKVDDYVEQVKAKKKKLMGFGHRVYKNYDPRAKIVRRIAHQVFEVCGREPMIDIAVALEKRALSDDYFLSRKLYPNIDFYSGLIYKAMGFPTDFFPVLFAIPRVSGWLAHWSEGLADPENKIWRPRQMYTGHAQRDYVPMENRPQEGVLLTGSDSNPFYKRRNVASWSQ